MNLTEARRRYDIPLEMLEDYVAHGFIRPTHIDEGDYLEEDFERIGLIAVLIDSGCSNDEIHRYLSLEDGSRRNDEQLMLLKKFRKQLHGHIRKKQKVLDQMDYLIREISI